MVPRGKRHRAKTETARRRRELQGAYFDTTLLFYPSYAVGTTETKASETEIAPLWDATGIKSNNGGKLYIEPYSGDLASQGYTRAIG